jgi:hypothetical protein
MMMMDDGCGSKNGLLSRKRSVTTKQRLQRNTDIVSELVAAVLGTREVCRRVAVRNVRGPASSVKTTREELNHHRVVCSQRIILGGRKEAMPIKI